MKPLVRAVTLSAVLGFTCLSVAHGSSPGACRYFCGGMIHEVYVGSTCCSQTFDCNGTPVSPYGYYAPTGWRFC